MKGNGYLSFTKKERTGIISLIIVLLLIAFMPGLFSTVETVHLNLPDEKPATLPERNGLNDSAGKAPRSRDRHTGIEKWKEGYPPRDRLNSGFEKPQRKSLQPFDINTADTTMFIALPGIGSRLAGRIVSFREKLGGFVNVNQVSEVYGLHDSVYRKIAPFMRCNASTVKKININSAGKEDLKNHPYIRWKMANDLVIFRNEHGLFETAGDLRRMDNVDTLTIEKLIPYLSFER